MNDTTRRTAVAPLRPARNDTIPNSVRARLRTDHTARTRNASAAHSAINLAWRSCPWMLPRADPTPSATMAPTPPMIALRKSGRRAMSRAAPTAGAPSDRACQGSRGITEGCTPGPVVLPVFLEGHDQPVEQGALAFEKLDTGFVDPEPRRPVHFRERAQHA